MYIVVRNINRCAEIYIRYCTGIEAGLRVNSCEGDGMYLVLGLIKLMGIIQKQTLETHVIRDHVLETSVFPELVSQGKI